MGTALLITGFLVWWAQVLDPMQERIQELNAEILDRETAIVQLTQQHEKLVEFVRTESDGEKAVAQFSGLTVEGKRIEDVNANTQSALQQLLDQKGVSIKTYKELPPSKWREQNMGRIELQFETYMQGLSDVLEQIESLNKLIRVEKLTITYRRTKQSDLNVSIQIGTLFPEGIRP